MKNEEKELYGMRHCFRHDLNFSALGECPICSRLQYEEELMRKVRKPLENHIDMLNKRIDELQSHTRATPDVDALLDELKVKFQKACDNRLCFCEDNLDIIINDLKAKYKKEIK